MGFWDFLGGYKDSTNNTSSKEVLSISYDGKLDAQRLAEEASIALIAKTVAIAEKFLTFSLLIN